MSTVYVPDSSLADRAPASLAPRPMTPEPWRVQAYKRETYDTFTLTLTPESGTGFAFEPGQFTMLWVYGVGEVPISISGDPGNPEVLIHTIRSVGATTRALSTLRRGDTVGVRGPFGTPWPVKDAVGSDVVIAAGGVGLAPVRPSIYHILSHRADYGRVSLLYGARTPQDILFARELEEWRGRFDIDVLVTVDAGDREWFGRVGVVTTLIPSAVFAPDETRAMICGPEIMMRFTALDLERRGVDARNIAISMERNMQCGLGTCGHCQYGPFFICKDGPVFAYDRLSSLLTKREV